MTNYPPSLHYFSADEFTASFTWGEIKKPETVNYRTYKPEPGGLFCPIIFGPLQDYQCTCGKSKGEKKAGVVCPKCQVTLLPKRERYYRWGHVSLSSPVIPIWHWKGQHAPLPRILGLKTKEVKEVLNFQKRIVTRSNNSSFPIGSLIGDSEYGELPPEEVQKSGFVATFGAEGIQKILVSLTWDQVLSRLESSSPSPVNWHKWVQRVKIRGFDPTFLVWNSVPVLPPKLRPLVLLTAEGKGLANFEDMWQYQQKRAIKRETQPHSPQWAISDINDLYRRLVNRNNRLRRLLELNAPEVIVRNEKRMLQSAMDSLLDNQSSSRPVMGTNQKNLDSFSEYFQPRTGLFRPCLLTSIKRGPSVR